MSAIDEQKVVFRAAARAARRSIPVDSRADSSLLICAHIEATEWWRSAKVVTAFLPIQSEVDLRPLLVGRLGGRMLGIPRTENDVMTFDSVDLQDPDGLAVGEFGITVAHRRATIWWWSPEPEAAWALGAGELAALVEVVDAAFTVRHSGDALVAVDRATRIVS